MRTNQYRKSTWRSLFFRATLEPNEILIVSSKSNFALERFDLNFRHSSRRSFDNKLVEENHVTLFWTKYCRNKCLVFIVPSTQCKWKLKNYWQTTWNINFLYPATISDLYKSKKTLSSQKKIQKIQNSSKRL